MKPKLLSLIIFLIATAPSADAQEYNLGGGLSYGSGINNVGINLKGDITFNEQWSVSPSFNIFFNRKNGQITRKWWAFNIDGHYYFDFDNAWFLYPLLGFNIGVVTDKVMEINFSNTEIGMNLGGGARYRVDDRLSAFGEIKYVISRADQLVISIGMTYRINP